jgi:hypothetical protein
LLVLSERIKELPVKPNVWNALPELRTTLLDKWRAHHVLRVHLARQMARKCVNFARKANIRVHQDKLRV